VREAPREYFARKDLGRIRRKMVPLAEAERVLTGEYVSREVS
jgi:hypothetical protein